LEIKSEDIFCTLRELGIASGDLLLTHSSYKSIGGVKDGPADVVRALTEAVGSDGGCFVPTFNYGELPWQRDQTRSLTGIITETFRQMPGVIRSNHPTHSVGGVGSMAEEILAGHENINAFGEESPIWRLWKNNAWVLLIGVDHTANSTIHIAEEFLRLPYLNRTRSTTVIDEHGERNITLRRPPCSNGFNVVDAPLRARGQIRESRLGNARVLLMRSQDLVAVALELLRDDPAALLCCGGCEFCDESRKMLRTSKLP
jgi:aminoglycoside 3-N-acetyltransferase